MHWSGFAVLLLLMITNVRSEIGNIDDQPSEELLLKYLDTNSTITPRKIRFEEDTQLAEDYSSFDEQSGQPLRFEDSPSPGENSGHVTFQDDNRLEETDNYGVNTDGNDAPTRVKFQDDNRIADPGIKKKRRRRRRKPRYQLPPGQYNPGAPGPLGQEYQVYPGQYPGAAMYRPGGGGPGGPVGQYYRPRRPKQSFASEALSKVAGALTSIALYDDYQCVPRLLCEAAGGGALGSSPVLQSIAGLQPLLTLLSAYNGISASPLFLFGRAVFLGMTSKGNTASCRYAYPQCPTDPEQLVHYLNNHNGGFFRFFNSPQPQIPQNVEQFYNQLSGYGYQQNYGLYDPQLNQSPQNPTQQYGIHQPNISPQNYGIYNPQYVDQEGPYQPYPQNLGPQQSYQNPSASYGYYPPNPYPQPNHDYPQGSQQYGLYNNPYFDPPNPNLYANKFNYANHQNYGTKYPYSNKYGIKKVRIRDSNNKIEKRIQNKPSYLYVDSDIGNVDVDPKWIFPGDNANTDHEVQIGTMNNVRGGKSLKFPEENIKVPNDYTDSNRKGKSILFPESSDAKYVNYYEYPPTYNNDNSKYMYQNYGIINSVAGGYGYTNNNNYYNSNEHIDNNRYGFKNVNSNSNSYNKYMYNSEDEDGVQTVYVVRGNGDPNHPEIIKVRPGEKVML